MTKQRPRYGVKEMVRDVLSQGRALVVEGGRPWGIYGPEANRKVDHSVADHFEFTPRELVQMRES